jgi:hypothetical protein
MAFRYKGLFNMANLRPNCNICAYERQEGALAKGYNRNKFLASKTPK